MFPRNMALVLAAGVSFLLFPGSAAARRIAANGRQKVVPAAESQLPRPNAPYIVPERTVHRAPTPTPETVASAMPCKGSQLSVQEVAGDSHGSLHSVKLAFRNSGKSACKIQGFPTVAVRTRKGRTLGSIAMQQVTDGQAASELGLSPSRALQSSPAGAVILAPHAVAAFQVLWTAGSACPLIDHLLVTAPGTQRAFSVHQPVHVCLSRVQITRLELDQGDD